MPQRNPDLFLAYTAGGAIAANRFVKFGANDRTMLQAAAATDAIVGVSDLAVASGETVDVCQTGIFPVVYGGTVARGDLLTSDSSGRAITAAPGAGVNHRIGGVAMESGVVGDLGSVRLSPGSIQGAA